MNWKGIIVQFKYALHIKYWKCTLRYIRGISRLFHDRYEESFSDFQWILDNGGDFGIKIVAYKYFGIIYARQKKFDKAEIYLLKASSFKKFQTDDEILMWLGYIYLVKKSYSKAHEYFKKAQYYGQKGINKLLMEKEYIQTNIEELEKVLSK